MLVSSSDDAAYIEYLRTGGPELPTEEDDNNAELIAAHLPNHHAHALEQHAQDPELAIGALGYLLPGLTLMQDFKGVDNTHSPRRAAGVFRAVLREMDLPDSDSVERFREAQAVVREFIPQRDAALADCAALALSAKTAADKAETEWKRLRNAFEEQLSLKAPVTYWTARVKDQTDEARYYGIAAGGVAAVAAGVVAATLFGWIDVDPMKSEGLDYAKLIPLGLLITVLLWALRVLVRVTLSNLHLAVDAKERATVIQTYLALTKSADVKPEQDRHILLDAITRHAQSGLIRDDAAPPTPQVLLAKWLGKGSE